MKPARRYVVRVCQWLILTIGCCAPNPLPVTAVFTLLPASSAISQPCIDTYTHYNQLGYQAKLTGNIAAATTAFQQGLAALHCSSQRLTTPTSLTNKFRPAIAKARILLELAEIDMLHQDLAAATDKLNQINPIIADFLANPQTDLNPEVFPLVINLALFHLRQAQPDAAVTLLKTSFDTFAINTDYRFVLHNLLGQTYQTYWRKNQRISDWLQAEKHFQQSLNHQKPANNLNIYNTISLASFYINSENIDHIKNGEKLLKNCLTQLQKNKTNVDHSTQFINAILLPRAQTKIAEAAIKQADYRTAKQQLHRLLRQSSSLLPGIKGSKVSTLTLLARISGYEQDYKSALVFIYRAYQGFMQYATLSPEQEQARQQLAHLHLAILQQGIINQKLKLQTVMPELFKAMQIAQGTQRIHSLERMVLRRAAPSLQQDLNTLWKKQEQLNASEKHYTQQLMQPSVAQTKRDGILQTQLLRDIQQLHQKLKKNLPLYNQYLDPRPLSLSQAKTLLKPHEALLLWSVDQNVTYLLVIPYQQPAAFFSLDSDSTQLAQALNRNATNSFMQSLMNPQQTFNTQQAYALYKILLAPAESVLSDTQHLIVVTDAALQSLPLQALIRSPAPDSLRPDYRHLDWLISRYAVSYLPSAHALADLQHPEFRHAHPTANTNALIAFGDPLLTATSKMPTQHILRTMLNDRQLSGLNYLRQPQFLQNSLLPLPETADEIQYLAQTLSAHRSQVFLQAQATEQQLKRLNVQGTLQTTQLLMFSTHALLPDDNPSNAAFYALEPGLILTPPTQGSVQDDGYLTASEIANLNLQAEWVILAACKTGTLTTQDTVTGLSQLAKAFFMAGARSVLATQWNVHSQATTRFMQRLFAILPQTPHRAYALQQTMQMMAAQPAVCSLRCWLGLAPPQQPAHPVYWAGFSIYGAGGELPSLANRND
ncbi:MAG: hypothetical protein RI964_626 [Pseudomonadota bacterium]